MDNELKALLDRACTALTTSERFLSSGGAHIEARECRQTIGSITAFQMKWLELQRQQEEKAWPKVERRKPALGQGNIVPGNKTLPGA